MRLGSAQFRRMQGSTRVLLRDAACYGYGKGRLDRVNPAYRLGEVCMHEPNRVPWCHATRTPSLRTHWRLRADAVFYRARFTLQLICGLRRAPRAWHVGLAPDRLLVGAATGAMP